MVELVKYDSDQRQRFPKKFEPPSERAGLVKEQSLSTTWLGL